MNLNNDIAVVRARPLWLGPLHQLHPGRSRSLIRHHNRLHLSPPCVEFLPVRQQLDGLSDRNGSFEILASPASMRNAEWPCHVCFIGIVSSVMCLFTGKATCVSGWSKNSTERLFNEQDLRQLKRFVVHVENL